MSREREKKGESWRERVSESCAETEREGEWEREKEKERKNGKAEEKGAEG